MLSFLQHYIWPARDDDYIFIDRWEEAFGIQPDGTEADRVNRLISFMRQRGTMTQALVKSIMCRAWDSDDPSVVTLRNVDPADVAALGTIADHQAAELLSQMYIHHTAETASPDASLMQDLIAKNKPTYENWYYGRYYRLKWEGPPGGPGGGEGAWNQGCWS
jgi:hypothetical protein